MAINPLYTVIAPGVQLLLNKCLLGVFNKTGSGKVIRLYRAAALNNQTAVVTGIGNIFQLQRFTTGSGGLSIVPVKHDSTSPSLPAQIIISSGMNYTTETIVRSFAWSSDEPLAGDSATIDEFQCIPALNTFWDSSYSYINESIEPLVIREGYGFGVVLTAGSTAAIAGSADFMFEITVGDT